MRPVAQLLVFALLPLTACSYSAGAGLRGGVSTRGEMRVGGEGLFAIPTRLEDVPRTGDEPEHVAEFGVTPAADIVWLEQTTVTTSGAGSFAYGFNSSPHVIGLFASLGFSGAFVDGASSLQGFFALRLRYELEIAQNSKIGYAPRRLGVFTRTLVGTTLGFEIFPAGLGPKHYDADLFFTWGNELRYEVLNEASSSNINLPL